MQCSGLELQVWSSEETEADRCVGCVQVDLSPLAFGLGQLSGWYHIQDFAGQVQGQLKVSACFLWHVLAMCTWWLTGEHHSQGATQLPPVPPALKASGRLRGRLDL